MDWSEVYTSDQSKVILDCKSQIHKLLSKQTDSVSSAGQLIWEILDREWLAGLVFCKMFKFLQTYALASSNYMLVALAIDRHRAITMPLKFIESPYK